MTAPRPDVYATAVQAVLSSLRCGLGQKPADGGWPDQTSPGVGTFAPYLELWIDPGTNDGTIGDPNMETDFLFQLTAVGVTALQALQWQGRARDLLITTPPMVTGRSVQRVAQTSAQMPRRDDEVSPSLFVVTAQYEFCSYPA